MKTNTFIRKRRVAQPEKNEGKSMTQPNMALGVREIVEKRTRGLLPNIQKEGRFEMDDFGEEINPLRTIKDLTDLDEIKDKLEKTNVVVQETRKSRLEAVKKAEKEQLKEELKKEIAEEQKRMEELK